MLGLYLKELLDDMEGYANAIGAAGLFEGETRGRHWVYKRLNFPIAPSNSSESSLNCRAKARVSFQGT